MPDVEVSIGVRGSVVQDILLARICLLQPLVDALFVPERLQLGLPLYGVCALETSQQGEGGWLEYCRGRRLWYSRANLECYRGAVVMVHGIGSVWYAFFLLRILRWRRDATGIDGLELGGLPVNLQIAIFSYNSLSRAECQRITI